MADRKKAKKKPPTAKITATAIVPICDCICYEPGAEAYGAACYSCGHSVEEHPHYGACEADVRNG